MLSRLACSWPNKYIMIWRRKKMIDVIRQMCSTSGGHVAIKSYNNLLLQTTIHQLCLQANPKTTGQIESLPKMPPKNRQFFPVDSPLLVDYSNQRNIKKHTRTHTAYPANRTCATFFWMVSNKCFKWWVFVHSARSFCLCITFRKRVLVKKCGHTWWSATKYRQGPWEWRLQKGGW